MFLEDNELVGGEAVYYGKYLPIFQSYLLSPSPTLMMEAAGSSETSVDVYHTTRRHLPQGDCLRSPP